MVAHVLVAAHHLGHLQGLAALLVHRVVVVITFEGLLAGDHKMIIRGEQDSDQEIKLNY